MMYALDVYGLVKTPIWGGSGADFDVGKYVRVYKRRNRPSNYVIYVGGSEDIVSAVYVR